MRKASKIIYSPLHLFIYISKEKTTWVYHLGGFSSLKGKFLNLRCSNSLSWRNNKPTVVGVDDNGGTIANLTVKKGTG